MVTGLTASGAPSAPVREASGPENGRRFTPKRWLGRHPDAAIAGAFLVTVLLAIVTAPRISPYEPAAQSADVLTAPSGKHWFGTDALGRDTFSRLLHGGGPILLASLGAVGLAGMVGCMIGLAAGYRGGMVEVLLMRAVDVLLAFPSILLAILMVTVLGRGLYQVMIAVAVAQTPMFCRVCRAAVLALVQSDFVTAARALGASSLRIVGRHVLSNVMGVMIVQAALATALTIGYVGALSYIGLGVQPPQADWGTMISDASNYVFESPYLAIFPGVAIALAVLSFNFLADGLRDLLDPQGR